MVDKSSGIVNIGEVVCFDNTKDFFELKFSTGVFQVRLGKTSEGELKRFNVGKVLVLDNSGEEDVNGNLKAVLKVIYGNKELKRVTTNLETNPNLTDSWYFENGGNASDSVLTPTVIEELAVFNGFCTESGNFYIDIISKPVQKLDLRKKK